LEAHEKVNIEPFDGFSRGGQNNGAGFGTREFVEVGVGSSGERWKRWQKREDEEREVSFHSHQARYG